MAKRTDRPVSYTHLHTARSGMETEPNTRFRKKNRKIEALNAHQRTLRMRGRPKIVLARTYNEDVYK